MKKWLLDEWKNNDGSGLFEGFFLISLAFELGMMEKNYRKKVRKLQKKMTKFSIFNYWNGCRNFLDVDGKEEQPASFGIRKRILLSLLSSAKGVFMNWKNVCETRMKKLKFCKYKSQTFHLHLNLLFESVLNIHRDFSAQARIVFFLFRSQLFLFYFCTHLLKIFLLVCRSRFNFCGVC
jgi:hypothetical protein